MGLFLSTVEKKLDKKGRVSVPVPFRQQLASESFQGVVAYPSFVHPCIECCGMARMEQVSESIDQMDPFSEERDAFAASILGASYALPFDGEGRVILPEALLAECGLAGDVVFVGKGATFELWSPESFGDYAANARKLAQERRAQLRLKSQGGAV